MKLNIRNIFNDSGVYVLARYSSFFIAAIASALFNVFLFKSLDPSWSPLLVSLSIALEGAKLTTVLSIGVINSLYMKLNYKPLKRKAKGLKFYYMIYAFLSILASLGFSTYITARTQALQNSELDILVGRKTFIQNKLNEITSLQQSATIKSYLDYPLWISVDADYKVANKRYEEADSLDSLLMLNRDKIEDVTSQEWIKADIAYKAQNKLMIDMKNSKDRYNQERLRVQRQFEASKTDLNGEILKLNNELNIIIKNAGIEQAEGSTALILINEKIQEEELKAIKEKGMAYMYEGFSKYTFGFIKPDTIKMLILMLASFLLELTIYQCAPDIRVSKSILKYFKTSLPDDKTFKQILDLYDEDEKDDDLKQEPKQIIMPVVPMQQQQIVATMNDKAIDGTNAKTYTMDDVKDLIDIMSDQKNQEKKPRKKRTPKPKQVIEAAINEAKPTSILDNHTLDVNDTAIDENNNQDISKLVVESPNKDDTEQIQYRFAKTTEEIANKFVAFIKHALPDKAGVFTLHPYDAAFAQGLNHVTRDIFIDRLCRLTLGGKALVEKRNNIFYSSFDNEVISNYVLERLS